MMPAVIQMNLLMPSKIYRHQSNCLWFAADYFFCDVAYFADIVVLVAQSISQLEVWVFHLWPLSEPQ